MKGEETYRPAEMREHSIRSEHIAQEFKVRVLQPRSCVDNSERFPVVYVTDGDYFFGGLAELASLLQDYGETPRFILVGIGYGSVEKAALLRMRDFFTRPIQMLFETEIKRVADSQFASGVSDLEAITHTTEAREFLHFIRGELMPFINARYPTVPSDSNYSGYSAGGTFGLYTLFTKPDTFKRYIVGSPGTSLNGVNFGIELARDFIKSGQRMTTKVFMSVGELEEFHRGLRQFDLVTGYYQLTKFIEASAIAGLELKSRVFPDETHATAWPLAFSHGIRALFGAADQVPFWPGHLKNQQELHSAPTPPVTQSDV